MKLETTRLIIRPSVMEDAEAIHAFLSDEQTMHFFVEGIYDINKVKLILAKNEDKLEHYSIILKQTNNVVGKISFHPFFMRLTYEIGWIMHPEYTNRGLMTEAVEAMLDYGFNTLKLHRIIATVQPENIPSRRICERFMLLEGHFRKCIYVKDDMWWDELFYSVLEEDYKQDNR